MLSLSGNVPTGAPGKNLWRFDTSTYSPGHSMGFARLAETTIRNVKGKGENEKLTALEKIFSSSVGGALATWNQPIEVVRVEVMPIVDESYCAHLTPC